jgi:hypothetical protein
MSGWREGRGAKSSEPVGATASGKKEMAGLLARVAATEGAGAKGLNSSLTGLTELSRRLSELGKGTSKLFMIAPLVRCLRKGDS